MTADRIVAFLNARYDEEAAAAEAAPGRNWQAFTEDDIASASVYDEQWVLLYPERYDHDEPLSAVPGATGPQYIQRSRDELAAHIARHDPACVLREIEAKRAIILRCAMILGSFDNPAVGEFQGVNRRERSHAYRTLCELASAYEGHPEFDQAWRQ